MSSDVTPIYTPWSFIHSDEFTTDIVIEHVEEVYSTGDPISAEGEVIHNDASDEDAVQFYSYTKEDEDESDVHEQKFMLRFLATNTDTQNRYLWVTDEGEVRTDGGFTNLATFFEVIHWTSPSQNNFQLICYGGNCRNHILYMDGSSLKTRKYHEATDDSDITTKFQMTPRGTDISVRAFISKTGIPIYFDDEGNYRPEGPVKTPRGTKGEKPPEQGRSSSARSNTTTDNDESDTKLQPLYFITANVKIMHVTSV